MYFLTTGICIQVLEHVVFKYVDSAISNMLNRSTLIRFPHMKYCTLSVVRHHGKCYFRHNSIIFPQIYWYFPWTWSLEMWLHRKIIPAVFDVSVKKRNYLFSQLHRFTTNVCRNDIYDWFGIVSGLSFENM